MYIVAWKVTKVHASLDLAIILSSKVHILHVCTLNYFMVGSGQLRVNSTAVQQLYITLLILYCCEFLLTVSRQWMTRSDDEIGRGLGHGYVSPPTRPCRHLGGRGLGKCSTLVCVYARPRPCWIHA